MKIAANKKTTKENEVIHTSPPYKVEQGQGYHRGHWVITAEGMPPHSPLAHLSQICGPEESYPDAQFIITACNAHEELVAALKAANAELDRVGGFYAHVKTQIAQAVAKAEKGG